MLHTGASPFRKPRRSLAILVLVSLAETLREMTNGGRRSLAAADEGPPPPPPEGDPYGGAKPAAVMDLAAVRADRDSGLGQPGGGEDGGPGAHSGRAEAAAPERGRPSPKFTAALAQSEALLAFAASSGIPVGAEITKPLADARVADANGSWSAEVEGAFWPALSRLAAAVKPVTYETLKADEKEAAGSTTRSYFRWTISLGVVIVPLSIVMFINTSISNEIGDLIEQNDRAAVPLYDQLLSYQGAIAGSQDAGQVASRPALSRDIVEKLQQFTRVSRLVFDRSRILNLFILERLPQPTWAEDPVTRRANLELDVRLGEPDNRQARPIPDQGFEKLASYQDIRAFGRDVRQWNLLIYGAITAYVLPIAYAFLGACAYALRNLAVETRNKTFQPSYANFARVVIALIAGTVVGLFNNFTQGVSVSPLAIAFLVGYAVEVFFSFLDAFVQTFRRINPAEAAPATPGRQ